MREVLDNFFKKLGRGVCHRGLHDLTRPENSKAAFERAISLGLPFECDVHVTKDGRIVVIHDSDLSRVTGKEGIVEDLTLKEIQEGYHLFDGSYPLSIEELFSLWREKVPFVLELKTYRGNHLELANKVRPYLDSIKDKGQIVIISFDPDVLRDLKGIDIPLGKLIGKYEAKHIKEIDLNEFDFIDSEYRLAILSKIRKYHKAGGKVLTWTAGGRLSYKLGMKLGDACTWEIVNSSKPLKGQKENKYLKRFYE